MTASFEFVEHPLFERVDDALEQLTVVGRNAFGSLGRG